ncbi:hypothetical protein GC163_02945 [bacterium]|nr:hypothetical protein [bacterium]
MVGSSRFRFLISTQQGGTMSIEVRCTECGEEFTLKDSAAGKTLSCKVCGAKLPVPALDELDDSFDDDELSGELVSKKKTGKSAKRRVEAASRTFLPAVFLYIIAGLSVVNHGAGLVMAAMGYNLNPFVDDNAMNGNPAQKEMAKIGGMVGGVIGLTFDGLVLFGAYCMQTVRNYGMAMTGAIVACIPFCGPCLVLGIPFGIWSLVVLNNAEVKSAFA